MSEVLDVTPEPTAGHTHPHPEAPAAAATGDAVAGSSALVHEPVPQPPFTLAIDIGGSGIKCILLDGRGAASGKRRRRPTPRPATPEAVMAVIKELLPDMVFDRVSVGFPGVVVEGTVKTAPNLHRTWADFELQRAISELSGRPTRVINDAGVQGYGAISGNGVEIVLTLGTGMGFALFLNGRYVPNIELAHHPLRKDMTYEEYIGNAARQRVGNRKWGQRVLRVVDQVRTTFNPGVLYLGGGNVAKLREKLPEGVRAVDNVAGLLGGIALWR